MKGKKNFLLADKDAARPRDRRVAKGAPPLPSALLLGATAAQQVPAVERDLDLPLEADAAFGGGGG